MFLFWLVPLGIVAYYMFFNKGNAKIQFPNSKSAEETLKERFVNGDIDEETFMRMRETLNN